MTGILTFDTTHHALWAERIALEQGFGAQVIPAPADADAKCDLALEVLDEEIDALAGALRGAGVAFRRYFTRRA